jgi:hypothetical protein
VITSFQLTAPLELKASEDPKLPTRFGGVAYSGGLVPQWGRGIVVDLASTTFKDRIPMLSQHDHSEGVGVTEKAEVKDHALIIAGSLFSDIEGSRAQRIAQLAQRGMPFEMSIGLFNASDEFFPAGKTAKVNGREFSGPVTVLRGGRVREVSIVTLGADADTEAQMFSKPTGEIATMQTVEQLAARVAELETQLAAASKPQQPSPEALAAARAEGAVAERTRIQQVEAACLAGHEALIAGMKFDGKSTGADAAMAVLAAEQTLRSKAAAALAKDAPPPAKPAATPAVDLGATDPMADTSKPLAERCKAKWDSDPKTRAEFTSLEAFTALVKAEEAGQVLVLGKRAA